MTDTPVHELDGTVAGVHRLFLDRTAEVLAARRPAILNALARTERASGRREALVGALHLLDRAPDVPFAVGFLLDAPDTWDTWACPSPSTIP
ncbi:hypothetical protein [Virgisporangium ochraceum]|uniref:Uncharacterized protein n=1 Tax=Virgisporangium ochraceum TaxID=65505 RepID=A0A8J3ZWQ1_9ACTN|nr:hypothetical protein [Virgisporangium ochraceum]GIJ70578.1 hypothetical protein Voc01_054950 [Virgisporangium ochraceum]